MNIAPINTVDVHTLEAHEAAQLFPMMSEAELRELATDIQKNGLREEVLVTRQNGVSLVLDGRNRLLACRMAGVPARIRMWNGADPLAYVLSVNLRRRHLSESQRAMVAARLATLTHGGDRRSEQAAHLPVETRTQAKAAEHLNVSERSVRKARAVLDSGRDDLVHAVERGEMAVSAAAAIVAEPPKPANVAPPSESTPATKALSTRSAEAAQRREEILRMSGEGKLNVEIAETLGVSPSAVSKARSLAGTAETSPGVRLWRDIEHASLHLEGAITQFEKLSERLEGTPLRASDEEVQRCVTRMSKATAAIRKLYSQLRKQRPAK